MEKITEKNDMKKTIIIVSAVILMVIMLILFIPTQTKVYHDGGTKEYQAIACKIVVWNRFTLSGTLHKTSFYWYPKSKYSIDKLWDHEQQKSAEKYAKPYVWEKEGIGGDFTITLKKDGTFTYYEGMLSSFFGEGTWIDNNGIIVLSEQRGGEIIEFRFKAEKDAFVFIKEGSGYFVFCDVADGDRFIAKQK